MLVFKPAPLLLLVEPVPAVEISRPCGLAVVGTTAGTPVQALSYATRLVLAGFGGGDAGWRG